MYCVIVKENLFTMVILICLLLE